MANVRDPLGDLENRRVQLEGNVAKLQASLRHWQTWEIEYEGMKEEILELGDDSTTSDLEKLAESSEVTFGNPDEILLTSKEKGLILRTEKGSSRNKDQVLNLLSRRTEYVQQNIKTVSSLLRTAEERLAGSTILSQPEVLNEEGLPLTEIHEELDEDGNVVSSSTSVPSQTASKAVEALEKAAGDLNGKEDEATPASPSSKDAAKASANEARSMDARAASNVSTKKPVSPKKVESPKKRVSFADETKTAEIPISPSNDPASKPGTAKLKEAEEFDRKQMAKAIIPEDESPEDAALRRQMIKYNMEEIGAVVAEIDLEDDSASQSGFGSDFEELDVDDDYEGVDDEDDDEEEDEFGRTSGSKFNLDTSYVKRMQELSEKLRADAMVNVGPGKSYQSEDQAASTADTPISRAPRDKPAPAKKKGVRFAPDLDIQDSPEANIANILSTSTLNPEQTSAGHSITEHAPPTNPPPQRKLSKFKTAHSQASTNAHIAATYNAPVPPSQPKPPTQILADTLIERPFTASTKPPPPPDAGADTFDPKLLNQEISTEYHRLRSRQIQREGGFLSKDDEEQAEVPLTEEEGGAKRISRFKAARLGRG